MADPFDPAAQRSRSSAAVAPGVLAGLLLVVAVLLGLSEVSAPGWEFDTCGTAVAENPNADLARWTAAGNSTMIEFASACETALHRRQGFAAGSLAGAGALATAAFVAWRRHR